MTDKLRNSLRALSLGTLALTTGLALATSRIQERGASTITVPTPNVDMLLAESLSLAPPRADAIIPDSSLLHSAPVAGWLRTLSGSQAVGTRIALQRSGRYLPFIRAELRKRRMPEELAYLAMIESHFTPNARSHAQAVGMWQFTKGTAEGYGLRMDAYVDERKDPVRATEAALDHLQDLYNRFGSWHLAAAAYNSGSGRVGRVLDKHGGETPTSAAFWRIRSALPEETRDYVPKLIAAVHIAQNPGDYGFDGVRYEAPLGYSEVVVPGGTSLQDVARLTGVGTEAVEDLNPHLVRGITPPGEYRWVVRIPPGVPHAIQVLLKRPAVVGPSRQSDEILVGGSAFAMLFD